MIDDQLENWQRCYKDAKGYNSRTLSLEGRYRIERTDIDYEEEAPPPARKPLNMKEAAIIEKIVTNLPFQYKLIITVEYMYRWALQNYTFNKVCRLAKIKHYQWDDKFKQSKHMVENSYNKTLDTPTYNDYILVTT